MRTAIVSDLHLGSPIGEDLLRDDGIRRMLLAELASADRLVLLGDILELRELPLANALERARPIFEDLGEVMAGRSVVLVPGNHDHHLAEPLLEQQAIEGGPLQLEQRGDPTAGPVRHIATWLSGVDLQIAYPGIWLRDDVYATHGHYMDCHMSLPRIECIAAAVSMRAIGALPDQCAPADYERVLRPVYGLAYALAQGGVTRRITRPSERTWQTIADRNGNASRFRRSLFRAGLPAGIRGLNRLLRAKFDASLSPASISRSGIDAASEMAGRLRVQATHLITGHTHRGGPGKSEAEWTLPAGGHLHNTGNWVFAAAFHRRDSRPSPFWPGTITWLDESGPPRRSRLLMDRTYDELAATAARLSSPDRP